MAGKCAGGVTLPNRGPCPECGATESGTCARWTRAAVAAIEFVRWVIQESAWKGCDLDGADAQAEAERLGLIVKVPYDPEKHGPDGLSYMDVGDDWYVFAPALVKPTEAEG